eukprot:SAG31_NODE_166_length_21670_cov_22.507719_19_plen_385_part_00
MIISSLKLVYRCTGGCTRSTGCSLDGTPIWTSTRREGGAVEAEKRARALRAALRLIVTTSTFNVAAGSASKPALRQRLEVQPAQGRPYKAVVVLYLQGGADSFNMLVPHSNCAGGVDLYAAYATVREDVAIRQADLHQFAVTESGSQPCDVFGIHPDLPYIAQLATEGDASWIANIGTLIEPLTKVHWVDKSRLIPPALFGHNTQVMQSSSVHAQHRAAKGILGRIVDSLKDGRQHFKATAYSITGNRKIVEGKTAPDIIDKRRGVERFLAYDSLGSTLSNTSSRAAQSVFADSWAQLLIDALEKTESLGGTLDEAIVNGRTTADEDDATGKIGQQLYQVSRVIASRALLQAERDVFVVEAGSFDTHSDLGEKMSELLTQVRPP